MVKSDFSITFISATEATLRFRVQGCSKIQGTTFSPPCYILNLPWRIMIMPLAIFDKNIGWSKRYLGYFLQCNAECKSKKWSCYAAVDLTLSNACVGVEPYRRSIRHNFNAESNHYGYKYYIPWEDILDAGNGYMVDDAITLEVHIITEAPKTMGICFNWGNYEGRIFVPKEKWSDACKNMLERNCQLEKEGNNIDAKGLKLKEAEELFVLLHGNFSPLAKGEYQQSERQLTDKIDEE